MAEVKDIKRIIAHKKARLEHLESNWIAYTKNMESGELKEFKQSCIDDEIIIEALERMLTELQKLNHDSLCETETYKVGD